MKINTIFNCYNINICPICSDKLAAGEFFASKACNKHKYYIVFYKSNLRENCNTMNIYDSSREWLVYLYDNGDYGMSTNGLRVNYNNIINVHDLDFSLIFNKIEKYILLS